MSRIQGRNGGFKVQPRRTHKVFDLQDPMKDTKPTMAQPPSAPLLDTLGVVNSTRIGLFLDIEQISAMRLVYMLFNASVQLFNLTMLILISLQSAGKQDLTAMQLGYLTTTHFVLATLVSSQHCRLSRWRNPQHSLAFTAKRERRNWKRSVIHTFTLIATMVMMSVVWIVISSIPDADVHLSQFDHHKRHPEQWLRDCLVVYHACAYSLGVPFLIWFLTEIYWCYTAMVDNYMDINPPSSTTTVNVSGDSEDDTDEGSELSTSSPY